MIKFVQGDARTRALLVGCVFVSLFIFIIITIIIVYCFFLHLFRFRGNISRKRGQNRGKEWDERSRGKTGSGKVKSFTYTKTWATADTYSKTLIWNCAACTIKLNGVGFPVSLEYGVYFRHLYPFERGTYEIRSHTNLLSRAAYVCRVFVYIDGSASAHWFWVHFKQIDDDSLISW